jgi:hypothetical protein
MVYSLHIGEGDLYYLLTTHKQVGYLQVVKKETELTTLVS